jgi:hypothetical protein
MEGEMMAAGAMLEKVRPCDLYAGTSLIGIALCDSEFPALNPSAFVVWIIRRVDYWKSSCLP